MKISRIKNLVSRVSILVISLFTQESRAQCQYPSVMDTAIDGIDNTYYDNNGGLRINEGIERMLINFLVYSDNYNYKNNIGAPSSL